MSRNPSAYESVHDSDSERLEDDTDYFFTITGTDQAGNTVVDDNGGDCYTFMTTPVPDYFTEQFGSGVDLAGFSIRFSSTARSTSTRPAERPSVRCRSILPGGMLRSP